MQSVIVCCGTNGRCVVLGECESEPVPGAPITLHSARMVLYWPRACGGLFGLATHGPKDGLRLTSTVSKTATESVRQWLAISEEAAKGLRDWPAFAE
jgi:hypothetical protein